MAEFFTSRVDRRAELAKLRHYSADAVDHILREAAKVGANGAKVVIKAEAPIGTSTRLSQYYRAHGLGHGTLRASVRAAPIRGRGSMIKGLQARTVGYVIGPIGKNAFTRYWVEMGTRHQPGQHWLAHILSAAVSVARSGSGAVLDLYQRAH